MGSKWVILGGFGGSKRGDFGVVLGSFWTPFWAILDPFLTPFWAPARTPHFEAILGLFGAQNGHFGVVLEAQKGVILGWFWRPKKGHFGPFLTPF